MFKEKKRGKEVSKKWGKIWLLQDPHPPVLSTITCPCSFPKMFSIPPPHPPLPPPLELMLLLFSCSGLNMTTRCILHTESAVNLWQPMFHYCKYCARDWIISPIDFSWAYFGVVSLLTMQSMHIHIEESPNVSRVSIVHNQKKRTEP